MTSMNKRVWALAGALALAACGSDPAPNPNPNPTKPKPTIKTFTANPTTVARGGTTRLDYEVTNATSVSFSTDAGVFATPEALMGSVTTPAINADTVFILTAQGEGGTTTQRVTVTIDATAVAVLSFTATPQVVEMGGMTTLSWRTSGGKSIRLTRDGAEILANSSDRVNEGSETVTIDQSPTRFHLEVANDGGMTAAADVTVTIGMPVAIRAFTVRPQVFQGASGMISVSWTTENATALALTANGTAVPEFTGTAATGTITVSVSAATRFELRADGLGGPLFAVQNVSSAVAEVEPNNDQATATALNGGGATGELTAADTDYYTIMVPAGGNITAQISDGMGGCPFDSVLTLLDANGDELANNDDQGGNGPNRLCSLIDPRFDTGASDLPAGVYTLVVSGFDENETGLYALVVGVGAAACGNEIIEASRMEDCDDANMTANDGCDSMCRFETRGTVTDGGDMTFSGAIPENGFASYLVTLTSPGYISAETFVPTAGSCTDADTFIALLDATGAVLGSDDNDGIDNCSAISPARDTFARVDAGTYRVLLGSIDGAPLPMYAVRIRAAGPGCGNGVLEMSEACDDGNTANGDGCTAMCAFEYAGMITGGAADQTFSGAIVAGGALRYQVVVTSPVYLFAETGVPMVGMCGMMDSDTVLTLTSSSGRQVARNDDFGGTACSRIDPASAAAPVLLQPATYTLTANAFSAMTAIPALQTRIRLFGAGCGNGVVEGMEVCDDGNTTADGNGCSATCGFDQSIVQESEPNDTNMQADAVGNARTSTVVVTGGIDRMGADTDVYLIEVTGAAAALTARTHGRLGEPRSACSGADTVIVLRDAMGGVIARNDDGPGLSLCSEISSVATGTSASALAPGRYYLSVSEYGGNDDIGRYFLDLRLR